MMRTPLAFLVLIAALAMALALLAACGDDDDEGDDDDDDGPSGGDCLSYCEKVISCGDDSWENAQACAAVCEESPKRDCMVLCDPAGTCGDLMDCLAAC